jgi:hypothetical protein
LSEFGNPNKPESAYDHPYPAARGCGRLGLQRARSAHNPYRRTPPAGTPTKQLLNDQAYFVLCWAQLESKIDNACRAVIERRQSDANWEMRRGFDFYNPHDKRLSGLAFDRRVALVLDSGAGPTGPYARVMTYYETRNKIAHGELEVRRIMVSEIVADFYANESAIRT